MLEELVSEAMQAPGYHMPASYSAPSAAVTRAVAYTDLRVNRVISLIHEQYPQGKLTLGQLARQLNLSTWHLAHLFKKETGSSVISYLRKLRIKKAQELLVSSVFSIKEIAATVGYNHVSDFNHHFKALFDMSPGEYRRRNFASSRTFEVPRTGATEEYAGTSTFAHSSHGSHALGEAKTHN